MEFQSNIFIIITNQYSLNPIVIIVPNPHDVNFLLLFYYPFISLMTTYGACDIPFFGTTNIRPPASG